MSREAILSAALTAVQGVAGMKGAERGLREGTELAATDLPYAFVHSGVQTSEELRGRQKERALAWDVLTWIHGTETEAEALLELIRTALETDSALLALVESVFVSEDAVLPWPETSRRAIVVSVQTGRID